LNLFVFVWYVNYPLPTSPIRTTTAAIHKIGTSQVMKSNTHNVY